MPDDTKAPAWMDLSAGALSGTIAVFAGGCVASPLTRASLILRIQDAHPLVRSGAVKPYAGTRDFLTRIRTEQGLSSWWRGFGTEMAVAFPKKFITRAWQFAAKDTLRSVLPRYDPSKDTLGFAAVNVLSGGLAGLVPMAILFPLDHALFRIRTDVGPGPRAPASASIGSFFKTVTPDKWYTGFGISLPAIFVFRGAYFGVNDTLAALNPYKNQRDLMGLASKFTTAQIASVSASFAGYPLSVVVSRLRLQCDAPPSERPYRGTLHCFTEIARREGARGFWKGFTATWMSQIGSAVALVAYGEVQRLL